MGSYYLRCASFTGRAIRLSWVPAQPSFEKKNEIWHAKKKNNEILMSHSNEHIYYPAVSPQTYLLRWPQPPAPLYTPIVLLML